MTSLEVRLGRDAHGWSHRLPHTGSGSEPPGSGATSQPDGRMKTEAMVQDKGWAHLLCTVNEEQSE